MTLVQMLHLASLKNQVRYCYNRGHKITIDNYDGACYNRYSQEIDERTNHQLRLSVYSVLKITLRGRNGILRCSYRIVVVSTRVIPLLIGNQKRQFLMVLGTLAMLAFSIPHLKSADQCYSWRRVKPSEVQDYLR